jgi:cholera toxin transcriptional activator
LIAELIITLLKVIKILQSVVDFLCTNFRFYVNRRKNLTRFLFGKRNIDHEITKNRIIMPNETPLGDSPTTIACITIQSGRPDCRAYFYPSIYKLLLVDGKRKQKFDLGYAGSRLLERLLAFAGDAVAREDLIAYAWPERVVGQGSLNQQIYTLRQILGDEKSRKIIQTLPRRGYLFHPDFVYRAVEINPTELAVIDDVPDVETVGDADHSSASYSGSLAEDPVIQMPLIASASPASTLTAGDVSVAQSRKSKWQFMFAGSLALGIGVGTYLFYPAQMDVDTHVHEQLRIGDLGIVYSGENPERLEKLKARTHNITLRLVKVSNESGIIFWRTAGTYYELLCLSNNVIGKALRVRDDQLESIVDKQLHACFPK